jgi:hypothetical protein
MICVNREFHALSTLELGGGFKEVSQPLAEKRLRRTLRPAHAPCAPLRRGCLAAGRAEPLG